MKRSTLLMLGVLSLGTLGMAVAEAPRPQTRDDLMALIAPTAQELAWMKIPWETDLATARQKASAQQKPIFLWEMDGHPLGCV